MSTKANICPLCDGDNHCGNLSSATTNKPCWCADPRVQFPDSLLSRVDGAAKNTACICQTCARAHSVDLKK